MKKFTNWLEERQIQENLRSLDTHPLRPYGHFHSGRGGGQIDIPNMHGIEEYIEDGIKNNSGFDPVTGLNNLAAHALHKDRIPGSSQLDPHEVPSDRVPNSWKMTRVLQNLGFRDSSSFFYWFNDRNGRNIVRQLEKRIRQKLNPLA